MKEHQQQHKHRRYYIACYHPDQDPIYRTSEGSWTPDFYKAMLWSDDVFALKKAKKLLENEFGTNVGKTAKLNIGCVNVEVNGYFMSLPVTKD